MSQGTTRSLVSLLFVTLTLLWASVAAAQIVDGDLSDLEGLKQSAADDLINDVCPIGKSGFDIQRVLVYYDRLNDDLYVGLNLFDVPPGTGGNPPGLGFDGPGVPGDADGNNDPTTFTNIACQVKVDQPGVGLDETYVIAIDTDGDGNFETSSDFRIEYRNNDLFLMRGDGTAVPNDPEGVSAMMVLGTAGAGGGDTAIPNESENPVAFENPLTEDIELVVRNFSLVDGVPQCFRLQFFAGSLRDLLPEDKLTTALTFDPFSASVDLTKEARNLTQSGNFQDDVVAASTGDTLRFRLQVTNDGEIPLTSVSLSDSLPAGLGSLVSADPNCVVDGNSLDCQFASLGIGETKSVLFEAQVSAAPGSSLVNTAAVVAQTPPGECTPQDVQDQDPVTIQVLGIECRKQVSLDGVNYVDDLVADTGQTLFYRVQVTNDSSVTLGAVSLLDQLPAGLVGAQSDDPRVQINGGLLFALLGDLGPGVTDTILYRATIEATNPPTPSLTNTATVSGLNGEALVTSDCPVTVVLNTIGIDCDKNATLDGVVYSDSLIASPGQRVGFEVIITNSGTGTFFNVNLRDVLPPGFESPSSEIPGCDFVGNVLDCDLGPLGSGESIRVTYSARLAAQLDGDLTNTATVTGTVGSDSNPGVSRSESCFAVSQVRNPDIECEKLLSVDGVNFSSTLIGIPGQAVRFRIRATNTGGVDLFDVIAVDEVPAGYGSLTSSDPSVSIVGNSVTCILGDLSPGESRVCTFRAVIVATNPPTTELVNTAFVTGSSGAPGNLGLSASDSCSSTMPLLQPAVVCDKNVSLDGVSFFDEVSALPGDTIHFEVVVTNSGDSDFFQVDLEDILPTGFINPSTVDPLCSFAGNTLSCDLGALSPGASRRLTYRADVALDAPLQLTNTATITAIPGASQNPGTTVESSCSGITNLLNPEISCVKEVGFSFSGPFSPSVTAAPGQRVFFRVTATNDSETDVTFDSVRLTDVVPAGFTEIEILFGACNLNGATVSCDDLGSLPKDAQVTVVFSAVVEATNPPTSTLVNSAGVEGLLNGMVVASDECTAAVGIPTVEVECVKLASVDGVNFSSSISGAPGQTVIFRVDVTNAGSTDFFSVSLQDSLPAGYSSPFSLDGRCGFTGNDLNCDLGFLGAGSSTSVLYSASVDAGASGTLRNTATVTGIPGTADNPGAPDSSSCSADFTVQTPNLECLKTVSLNGVSFGSSVAAAPLQSVRFKVDITNTGSGDLFGVSLTDTLPDGFQNVAVVRGDCAVFGNTVSCSDLGTLAPGETVTLLYMAQLSETPGAGPLVNTAMVAATSGLPDNPGTQVSDECQASVDVQTVDLECEKTASIDGVNFESDLTGVSQGQLVTFRVTVRNLGEARFKDDISLTDVLPGGFGELESLDGRCTASGNTLSCVAIGPLEPGESTEILYRARVLASPPATLVNRAEVTGTSGTNGNPGAIDSSDCSATVTLGAPSIDCLKEVSPNGADFGPTTRVVSGENQVVTFRVTLTNDGALPLFTTSLTDVLPAGFADVESLDPRCSVVGNTFSCSDLGALAPGASTAVSYRARVVATNPPTETLTNTAEVRGIPGTAENPGEEVDDACEATVQILNTSLRCEKLVSANGVDFFESVGATPGQTMTFKVTVFNDSGSDVSFDPLIVTDVLPPQYENLEVLSEGCEASGNSLTCSFGPLGSGESSMLLYRGSLIDSLSEGTVVVNTASVTTLFEGVELSSECSATVSIQSGAAICIKEASLDGLEFSNTVLAAPGQRVLFRVTVQNTGAVDFHTVSVRDELPLGFEDVISETAGCTADGQVINCLDLGPLAAGESLEVRYRARVSKSLGAGMVLNNTGMFTAIPGTAENPGTPVTGQCSASTQIATVSAGCDKQGSLDGVNFSSNLVASPGQRIFFRIQLENLGELGLYTILIQDLLPAGFVNPQTVTPGCSFEGNSLICDVGSLGVGEEVTILYSAAIGEDVDGDLNNTLRIEARAGSPENPSSLLTESCTATVTSRIPAIVCEKNVSLDGVNYSDSVEAVPGQLIFYEIIVTNSGSEAFHSVTVTDSLPSGFENPATPTGGCSFVGLDLECDLGALAPGESRRIELMATLSDSASGSIENRAFVEGIPGSAENPGEAVVSDCPATVRAERPVIACLKEVSKDGVVYAPVVDGQVGETVYYRVTIRNDGPVGFFDVNLTDVLPVALSDIQSLDPDCTVTAQTLSCDLGPLGSGEERVIEYSARIVNDEAPIENVATVTAAPGSSENPGTPQVTSCPALVEVGPRRIPTLSEWGLLLLAGLLGAAMVLRRGGLGSA